MVDLSLVHLISTILASCGIFSLLFYVLQAWWLYMISKKLWDKYPWMAWIPLLSTYTLVKAWWKPWIWILWLIIWFILLIIPWLILLIIVLNWISKRTWRWVWTTIWLLFIPFIMLPIVWYNLKEWELNIENKVEDNNVVEL